MKIALAGYGKMGKAIENLALEQGHEIVLKIQSANSYEMDIPHLQLADVCIEFSSPSFAVKNILTCFDAGVPVVCGTTGWLADWQKVVDACQAKQGTLLYASNFSIGVNLFFQLNTYLAKLMQPRKEYHPAMVEIHHLQKKDAPSGTAITLAEGILEQNTHLKKWVNQESTDPSELAIISKREPDVTGIHEISYLSTQDKITICHEAFNRQGFAAGALLAAGFLQNKKGLFSMSDALNQPL